MSIRELKALLEDLTAKDEAIEDMSVVAVINEDSDEGEMKIVDDVVVINYI